MNSFAIHSTRVVTPDGLTEASVVISQGRIESVDIGPLSKSKIPTEDLGHSVIMPGLIDSHVHINEPGRTEWEGFDTATRAAAAGGITTLVDMPLNSTPVTTHVAALEAKLESARKSIHVNCGFYGGLVPGNENEMEGLIRAGVFGIKAFLTHSGIDDFPQVDQKQLEAVLPVIRKLDSTLLVHAELDETHSGRAFLESNPTTYLAYLQSRPRSWEDKAIDLMIRLAERYGARVHIVHLSSSDSVAPLASAMNKGIRVSTETCPHYLVFASEDIRDGETLFKCAPPIRERENSDRLWQALRNGVISFVVTDHSPAPPAMKELETGNFRKAWGGIAGLQFSLPATWTAARSRGYTLENIAMWMSRNVAKFLQLDHRKGSLAIGMDADLAVWNPEEDFQVSAGDIQHRHKITPYAGMKLSGVVERTYVTGNLVFKNGIFHDLNKGELLLKK